MGLRGCGPRVCRGSVWLRSHWCPGQMSDGASELERMVVERLQAEIQALEIKFLLALCFVAILFVLAAASLFWVGLKFMQSSSRGRRSRRSSVDDANPTLGEPPSSSQVRTARHLLRNRMSHSASGYSWHDDGTIGSEQEFHFADVCHGDDE